MTDLIPESHDSTDPLFLAVVDALNAETSIGDWYARDLARRLTPRLRMTDLASPRPPEAHVYLSTGCLHGEHGYCRATVGGVGRKVPATCKFCGAACVCPCHRDVSHD